MNGVCGVEEKLNERFDVLDVREKLNERRVRRRERRIRGISGAAR